MKYSNVIDDAKNYGNVFIKSLEKQEEENEKELEEKIKELNDDIEKVKSTNEKLET